MNKSTRKSEDATTVFLYDEIGFFGIQAEQFVRDFSAIDSDEIHLRINSPGGSVFDGVAIMNAVERHPASVTAHVDGLAASMASGIAMAADKIVMSKGSFMMIHDPFSLVVGTAEDMRQEADLLDNIADTLAANYASRTGREDIRELMLAETWMNHDQAVEMGFADEVEESDNVPANVFDLKVFKNPPAALSGERSFDAVVVERTLRDAGLSRAEAKELVHIMKSRREASDDQRDADVIAFEEVLESLRSHPDHINNVRLRG